MDWNQFLIGIAFLIGAFILYKTRKWDYYKGNREPEVRFINKLRAFKAWMLITMSAMVGIVYLIKSL